MSICSLSREAELLLLSAGPAENDPKISLLLQEALDWSSILTLTASTQGIPVLYNRLNGRAVEGVPEAVSATASKACPDNGVSPGPSRTVRAAGGGSAASPRH